MKEIDVDGGSADEDRKSQKWKSEILQKAHYRKKRDKPRVS